MGFTCILLTNTFPVGSYWDFNMILLDQISFGKVFFEVFLWEFIYACLENHVNSLKMYLCCDKWNSKSGGNSCKNGDLFFLLQNNSFSEPGQKVLHQKEINEFVYVENFFFVLHFHCLVFCILKTRDYEING